MSENNKTNLDRTWEFYRNNTSTVLYNDNDDDVDRQAMDGTFHVATLVNMCVCVWKM